MFRSLRDRTARIIAATAIVLGASPAAAQEYPTRPITFIVAFAPGGFADSVARLLGSKLSERLGQSIIIENRAGGGGNIGAAAVSKAAPDGYTLLVTTTGLAINETLSKSKGFAVDDLAVVTIPAWAPETLSVNPSSPTKNLAGLLQIAKTKPINYASPGVGTSGHIANAYLFQELAKVEAVNVPFQGGALAVNALLGGHVDALAGRRDRLCRPVEGGIDSRHCRRSGTAAAGASRHPHLRGERISRDHRIDLGRHLRPGTNRRGDPAEAQHVGEPCAAGRSTQSQLQALRTEFRIGDRADAGDYFRRDVARWQKMIIRIGLAPEARKARSIRTSNNTSFGKRFSHRACAGSRPARGRRPERP